MAIPDPKYVLDLAQQIVSAKANLAELQAKWDALFAPQAAEETVPNKGGRKPDPEGNSAKVIAAINSDPTIEWNVEKIEKHTHLTRKQVEKCLFNLCATGKIRRVGRGLYAAMAASAKSATELGMARVN